MYGYTVHVKRFLMEATISAFLGFSFEDERTVNSKNEFAVATSGSHNLRRRSNCNLCASSLTFAVPQICEGKLTSLSV